MFHFLLLVSRQGKVRLCRWFGDCEAEKEISSFLHFAARSAKARNELIRDAAAKVLQRNARQCNVIEWREDTKLVFKRYASLFFIACVDANENALLVLEVVHHYVEVLDKYFGNVCELDLIFNFHKAYYLLDEVICGGELQESSKKAILRIVGAQDALTEETAAKPSKLH
ncbi:clathrin-associated adaptor complex small chan, putative [Eimeria tenella]|uniref:AP complex subunit sigma n=1 Tax=Eimeria tenella TaxID=5802 RepID=H9B9J3_EIMTE|nr:clathrin-associated adaptor complex small chan, putative [Eimeria tenella]AET50653.1 hypothetical protein [Eimeria tenella]CDJ39541.1 clathrin-associated adaptor complex small chan, putative [Eimeria tenella]|eukprot:XP_013230296.1 clathrin-associated adaptor complex small chan, putative [Eimeria tenella]